MIAGIDERQVGEPADDAVEPAAEVAGGEPERDAERQDDDQRLRDADQRHPRAHEQPLQHVASERVGARADGPQLGPLTAPRADPRHARSATSGSTIGATIAITTTHRQEDDAGDRELALQQPAHEARRLGVAAVACGARLDALRAPRSSDRAPAGQPGIREVDHQVDHDDDHREVDDDALHDRQVVLASSPSRRSPPRPGRAKTASTSDGAAEQADRLTAR